MHIVKTLFGCVLLRLDERSEMGGACKWWRGLWFVERNKNRSPPYSDMSWSHRLLLLAFGRLGFCFLWRTEVTGHRGPRTHHSTTMKIKGLDGKQSETSGWVRRLLGPKEKRRVTRRWEGEVGRGGEQLFRNWTRILGWQYTRNRTTLELNGRWPEKKAWYQIPQL